jgi:hypothetical protein
MPRPMQYSLTPFLRPRAPRLRRVSRVLLAALVSMTLGVIRSSAEITKEYEIKAAFLYNFSKFIEWPAQRFAAETDPIVIGVLGRNPFDGEFEKIIRGRQANGRNVVVRIMTSTDEARSAHLVFVTAGEEDRFAAMSAKLREAAVVTVGESDRFATLGGTIIFVRDGDKVRFIINLVSAEAARTRISSQLLKLASEVRRKP